ncbi:MAG TPA: HdeD family acid-resistance protein [Stellaceae bacterium]|jgi:uncharacterized membrane protein HdeD (DUF308 family)|nr:HdeD family acid-resistance protein [Stellaceae bacterium]
MTIDPNRDTANPLARSLRSDAMSLCLAGNWLFVLLRGIFGLIAGLIAIFLPGPTLAALVLLFGVYMVFDGVAAIVSAVRAAGRHERWGLFVLEGLAGLVAAAAAFFWPGLLVFGFVMLTAAWAIISGALMLRAAFHLRADHGRLWLGLGGVVSILWGMVLVAAPGLGAVVLTIWFGIYALIFGATLVILGLRLRRAHSAPAAV